MDYLWSPWRYQYVTGAAPSTDCIFCAAPGEPADAVVFRGARNFVMLNRYPYTSGHVMIAPYEHLDSLVRLPEETAAEMMLLAREASRHIRELYHPEGLNFGINEGKCAGAGVAGHVHLHVLPRWTGDTNFMTTVGETRVLPEDLALTYRRFKEAWR